MRKVYFLLVLSLLSFKNFAATWYANSGLANDVNNWWSDAGYTGTHPVDFNTHGDIYIMDGSMNTSTTWNNSGSLIINSGTFTPLFNVTIGGDLTLNGSSVFSSSAVPDINLYLLGNLSVNGTALFDNPPAYTHLHFANIGTTPASPQTISWTSTNSGVYVNFVIDANVTVKLLTDVTWPNDLDQPNTINGSLVCDNHRLFIGGSDTLNLNDGGSLYTMNMDGVDSTIHGGILNYSPSANYIFNGTLTSGPQQTGMMMPGLMGNLGSVTIDNPSGVWLAQFTIMNDGSTLTLNSGNLVLAGNSLGIAAAATLAGTFGGTSKIVTNGTGELLKQCMVDGTYTFPVGDLTNYSPLTVNMTAATYGSNGYLAVGTKNVKHPNNNNLSDYLNRYWSFRVNDITTPSYTTSASYVPGDVMGTEASISCGAYASMPWMRYGVTNTTTHTLTSGTLTDMTTSISGISTANPSLTVSASTAVCIGNSATLAVLTAIRDTPFTYSWAPAGSLSVATGTSVVATPAATTTYTVTMTDANGFTGTATTTVTVNQYPNIDTVTGGGGYCAGGTGVHIGLNTTDTGVNYQLYRATTAVGSPLLGAGSALDMGLSTVAGTYTIKATGVHTGCVSNMYGSANVTIIPVVVPTLSLSSVMGDTLCTGTMTTFTTSYTHGGTAPSFRWTKNGTTVGADSMNYSAIPTNGNVIIVKMRSNEICAIPDSVSDTLVMSVITYGTPTVTITSDMGNRVCQSTGVTLTAGPTFGGWAPAYTWIKNTLIVGTGSTYAFTPANGDNVYCLMNSNYQCRLATDAYSNVIDMVVDVPVVPYLTIAAFPGTNINVGNPDTLVATAFDAGTSPSYQWYLNAAAVSGATTNRYIKSSFTDKDSVSCKLTRNDVCGLSSINSVVIRVARVGVNELSFSASDIALVPNPNNGSFNVSGYVGANNEMVTLEITNMIGQVVYKNAAKAVNGQLNEQVVAPGSLSAGVYVLNVLTANGNATIRFVIEK